MITAERGTPGVATARLADRCIDALLEVAVHRRDETGWPAWRLRAPGEPPELAADDLSLYNGDAGVGWALAQLGAALGRPALLEAAARVRRRISAAAAPAPGLLAGAPGIAFAIHAIDALTGGRPAPPAIAAADAAGADLTDGAAGVLLAQIRTGGEPTALRAVLDAPGAAAPGGGAPGPCGLAHGCSGVALALAEAAATGAGGAGARAAVAGALREERRWFDPLLGWPDTRSTPRSHPVMWCHGAAGIAAVRLRLERLASRGLALDDPPETLRADAQAAVQICRRHLETVLERSGTLGAEAFPGGLTVCHGLGGALDVMALASETWDVPEHLHLARAVVARAADVLGDDVLAWPCGVPQEGSCALFVGAAGVAIVLARLAWPERGVASPSLLGPVAP